MVCPRALVAEWAMLYLVATQDGSADGEGIRVFRLDRIEGAELLEEKCGRWEAGAVEEMLARGKAFIPPAEAAVMRVRYSPGIARWIAEREGVAPDADGGLTLEHVLADPEWGIRHVLQYGAEAEVLGPAALRERLVRTLERMEGL